MKATYKAIKKADKAIKDLEVQLLNVSSPDWIKAAGSRLQQDIEVKSILATIKVERSIKLAAIDRLIQQLEGEKRMESKKQRATTLTEAGVNLD